ncbi:hypothetical protein KY284_026245 [Solanum tuberosum]|nr:hypothetical protein KY284_026245 [Solanum tuberosum]
MPHNWLAIVQFPENYTPVIISKTVRWMQPRMGRYKCNTDESSKVNAEISSKAYCIRIAQREFVYAKAKSFTLCSAVEAEVKVFKCGLMHCLRHNYTPLVIETDSILVPMKCGKFLGIYQLILRELPTQARIILQMDKNGVPSIRIKEGQNNNHQSGMTHQDQNN